MPWPDLLHLESWFQLVESRLFRGLLSLEEFLTHGAFHVGVFGILGAACHGDLTEKLKLLYKMHVLPGK